jgi:hypothetical protein
MKNRTVWGCVVLAGIALALLPTSAQQGGPRPTLTADDHVQIQQLVARFGYALDTGANDGGMFADLFAPDGSFGTATGRAQLIALARTKKGGPPTRHFASNVIIQPAAQGATGTHYEAVFAVGQDGRQSIIAGTGRYEDTFVKTAAGWRFRTRTFHPSITTPEADKAAIPQAPGGGGPQPPIIVEHQRTGTPRTLSAFDYLEIQRLVASYGHALDNGFAQADNGPAYAGLFTPDGVAFRRLRGFEPLAAIARAQPHGPRYARHFLTNVTIAPTPDGATGKQYLIVIDPPEGGKPGRLFLGGHYEDIYVMTGGGWRYKSRTLFNANVGAEVATTAPPSEPMPAPVRVATSAPRRGPTLSSEDYVELQQLVARYAFALDTADGNGATYADLFTPDGTFNDAKGRDALAALPRGPRRGPLHVRNYGGLAILEPTADGARGIQYAQAMDFEPGGRTGVLDHFGHYEDVYARTPQGWRFKSRRFVNESQLALKGQPAGTAAREPQTGR